MFRSPTPSYKTERVDYVTGEIVAATDLTSLEHAFVACVRANVLVTRLCLFAHEPIADKLRLIAALGLSDEERTRHQSGADIGRPRTTFRAGRALIETGDAAAIRLADESESELAADIRALVSLPVTKHLRPVGVLGAASTDPYAFGEEQLAFLREVGTVACDTYERLRAAADRRQLDAAFQEEAAGVMLIDARTFRVVDINREAARILGRARQETVGHRCREFACRRMACPLRGAEGHAEERESILSLPDGREVAVRKSARAVQVNGRPHYLERFVLSGASAAEQDAG